ncbi:hypothetical protein L218DRAFT_986488 [Marasmius fiardii PR-910]|nr:hypothetical protein L218DRAFT_986488 [Marasmius fiardii PR-910]
MPVERANLGSSRGGRGQSNNRGRGRSGRGGRASRGRGGGRGGSSNVPYVPPTYPPQSTLYFRSASDPDLIAKLNQPRSEARRFWCRCCHNRFSLGDSDTGNGARLTDAAVQSFVSQTPNLVSLSLDACTHLSNATLIRALEFCPRLQHLRLTGNDKVKGNITDLGLKLLREREDLGVDLKELVLYDQGLGHKSIQDLAKAKKGLIVREGETLGRVLFFIIQKSFTFPASMHPMLMLMLALFFVRDGIAANMFTAMEGGVMTTAWKNGKRIGFDVDTGFGYGSFDYDMFF